MTKSRNILAKRKHWTPIELELLRANYADTRTEDLATALDRDVRHVYAKAKKLGLHKSEAYLASDLSGRVQRGKQDPRMRASQFKPGHVPANKGTHYVAGGRSAETRFKPGQMPHTWKPVGSYRTNADGYLDRKISDTGYPPRDWVGVHRLVWTEVNGPIPEGHVVVFKPGRRTTELEAITLDAVECITRRELMRRNSLHTQYPPEVARLVQLRGAITRQINKRAKEAA